MRKTILLKILMLTILIISLIIPNCYAATASLSANKTTAQAGDTVEVYIDLGIESIAYNLNVSLNDSTLVKEKEMDSGVGQGTADRIYLIQVLPEAQRVIYQPGTRLAILKYTLADNITENKTLTITVSGDIAGKSSSEKNTFNESISINVTPKTSDSSEDSGTDNNQGTGTQEETTPTETKTEEIEKPAETTTGSNNEEGNTTIRGGFENESNTETESKTTNSTAQTTKTNSNTKFSKKLPQAGSGATSLLVLAGVLALAVIGIEAYRKNK